MKELLLRDVFQFAVEAHKGQKRKYTGEDYIVHPMAVCRIVERHGGSEDQQCAALLHDVVEDTQYTLQDIHVNFGHDIATLVQWLTDTSVPEDGNRAIRKGIDRKRLAKAPAEAQFIKLADMIDNSKTIFVFDKSFGPLFREEMGLLVDAMTKVEGSSLWIEAKKVLKYGVEAVEDIMPHEGDYSLRRSEV
jgi:(p)ppGpp synthase/HD superfamily hydrolase